MPALRVLLLLLLTACGGGEPAARPPSADAPVMSPSVTVPSSSPDALVLAVSTAKDGLSLYALAPESSEATTLRDLAGPPGFVYTTSANRKDVVTSVRWASQDSGTPISGLPAGAVVLAQP